MQTVVNLYFPVAVIFYTVYEIYSFWEEHSEKVERLEDQASSVESKIKRKIKEIKKLQNLKEQEVIAQEKIEAVKKEVEDVRKKLPDVFDDNQNLATIKRYGEDLKMSTNISRKREVSRGFYFTKDYILTGDATFLQFLLLMEKIAASDRLLNVKAVEIKNSDKSQRGRFPLVSANITLEAYRYNPGYVPPAPTINKKKKK